MKIICDTCGAKYSIADEKVRGKVFKIRCKKCKEIIVVRGTSGAEDGADSAQAMAHHAHDAGQGGDDYGYDPATSPVWHVVLDGEQQGPYTAEQVGQFIAAGQLDYEAYCWRDGFADWMHLHDIQELYSVVAAMAQPQQEPQPAYQDDIATAAASGAAMGAYGGADPYGGMSQQPQDAGYGVGYGQPVAAPTPEPQAPVGFTAPASAAAAPASANEAVSDLFGSASASEPAMTDPVASHAMPGAGFALPSASEEAARGGGHDAGADLFAQPDDGGGFAAEQGGQNVLTSSPRVEVSRMTGTRNENSVLFSLSNLQALASSGGAATGPSPGFGGSPSSVSSAGLGAAQGEGSGLIDIRAMAAAAQDEKNAAGGVDELLSIGGGGGFAPTLGAPVLMAQPQESSSKLMFALIGVGAAVVVGIVILVVVLIMGGPGDEDTVAAIDQPSLLAAADSMNPAAAGTAPGIMPGAASAIPAAPGAPAAAPAPVPTGEESAQEEGDDSDDGSGDARRPGVGGKRVGGRAPGVGGGVGGGTSAPARPAEPSAPAKAPPGGGAKRGGSGDLDALLDGALGGGGGAKRAPTPAAAPAGGGGGGGDSASLPDSLSRSQVQSGMNLVAGAVRRCGQGQSGTVMVNVVISGSTGRVTGADVGGQFAGSPVGSCAARAVRGARFPRFRQSSLSVRYPFQVQ